MKKPQIAPDAVVLPGAVVLGEVSLGAGCSVWYHAVARGDCDAIRVGARTNIQDCAVLHTDEGHPLTIGEGVTVGHGAILHGCTVGDNSLIGMGAILLNDAVVGRDCLVAAGALVTGGTVLPDGTLAMGSPAKAVRPLTEEEKAHNAASAAHYCQKALEAVSSGEG